MYKNNHYIVKFLLYCIILIYICSTPAYAINQYIIDTENASDGYFSIYCSTLNTSKIKIGVTFDDNTTYHDYLIGKTLSYAFVQGDGLYTITIYQNIKDNLYRRIASKQINVKLENKLSPYLVNTYEISFSDDDNVCKKADELCQGLSNSFKKIIMIYNFISRNISYDHQLAEDIINGKIEVYHPKAIDVLDNKKGICYDYAVLFAAMCRSQDIPCDIVKGYYKGIPHAWNKVYINNRWYLINPSAKTNYY